MFRCCVECLEEIGYLIDTYGIAIVQPGLQVGLKQIVAQIADQDNKVRNAALNTTVTVYQLLGDNLYKHVGTVSTHTSTEIGITQTLIKLYFMLINLFIKMFLVGTINALIIL